MNFAKCQNLLVNLVSEAKRIESFSVSLQLILVSPGISRSIVKTRLKESGEDYTSLMN